MILRMATDMILKSQETEVLRGDQTVSSIAVNRNTFAVAAQAEVAVDQENDLVAGDSPARKLCWRTLRVM